LREQSSTREKEVRDLSLRETSTSGDAADLTLTIAQGVESRDGVRIATNDCPWLRLGIDARRLAGRWVRLTYAAGLTDPLVRPVLRCFVGDIGHDEIMPAALFGRAIWLGRIPKGARAIWISPTNQPGRFAFAIEQLEIVARARLWWEVIKRNPRRGWICLWARAIGMRHLARLQVKRTLCATPLRDYHAWRMARARSFDAANFDAQTSGKARPPHIRILAQADPQEAPALLTRLTAQPYPHWSIELSAHGAQAALEGLADEDLVVPFKADDLLADYALAALARAAADYPEAEVFYGDEDHVDAQGERTAPRLKLDCIADFLSDGAGIGAPFAIKVGLLRGRPEALKCLAGFGPAPALWLALDVQEWAIRHIRRVLHTRPLAPAPAPARRPPSFFGRPSALQADAAPRASIIVTTRDRLDLLTNCLQGLKTGTRLAGAEILIVDNNSVREETKTFLADLARDARFRVLPMPGRFNFSRLCNQAALQARAAVLVFLNNDIEIVHEDWLDELLAIAVAPDVGAVGAKLLYPNGRIQHAGVVIGIDGRAGHFERGLDGEACGYFGHLNVLHEVSAVTGACLAIEAKKFFAVGGFDEVNLPVELNDVDLCLRLRDRGLKIFCAPAARLIHRESASRGASLRPDQRYGAQHAHFRTRWAGLLRDDPYFHPALSLDSLRVNLG
jgi:O-antigen biosynthesis protein